MEIKYIGVLILGIILALLTATFSFIYKDKKTADGMVKLANTDLLLTDKYFKKQMIRYYILRVILVLSLAIMIVSTFTIMARPYYIKKIKEQKYSRDIILCMDISASVDELNLKLVKQLEETVKSLSGERIGIVIFNTTPVVLSPLTDDYEYTIEQLENIRKAIESQSSKLSFNSTDWLYWNEYLYGGTLIGNELRGSSLIGDGLLGGLFAFPDLDNDRTKIIIFSTDNDLNGEGYVNLQEAADYCKNNDVTVYGIGTKLMYKEDLDEMKSAVESTGGRFFVEEKASTFHEITDEIESRSEGLVEGKTIIKLIESPEKYFIILIVSFLIFLACSIILRRVNIKWALSYVAMVASMVCVYLYAILPAHQFSKGPDMNIKKSSNLNVLIVIDDTISMIANDMEDNATRLDRVKEDTIKIIDDLEGAQFSVVSFNNDVSLLAPFSFDTNHVKNAISSIYPLERLYAKGSSLDIPKDAMLNILKSIKADKNQKTAVFFISDGEVTSSNGSVGDYSELSEYIDGGAVLLYGTKEGGTMTLKSRYKEEGETIEDYEKWPVEPAVSVCDEGNMQKIAKDLSLDYRNMSEQSDLSDVILKLKSQVKTEEKIEEREKGDEYITPPAYYGYYALIPLTILMFINAMYVIKKK